MTDGLAKLKFTTYKREVTLRISYTAIMASDPYEFIEEVYQGTGIPGLSDSLMETFNNTSSEEEFEGFLEEDVHFGVQSRVKNFHHRRDSER